MKETGIAIITGSGGLVGVESVNFFSQFFDKIIGIDNDSRGYFLAREVQLQKT
jgi:CDP-paratose 2-epimerase